MGPDQTGGISMRGCWARLLSLIGLLLVFVANTTLPATASARPTRRTPPAKGPEVKADLKTWGKGLAAEQKPPECADRKLVLTRPDGVQYHALMAFDCTDDNKMIWVVEAATGKVVSTWPLFTDPDDEESLEVPRFESFDVDGDGVSDLAFTSVGRGMSCATARIAVLLVAQGRMASYTQYSGPRCDAEDSFEEEAAPRGRKALRAAPRRELARLLPDAGW